MSASHEIEPPKAASRASVFDPEPFIPRAPWWSGDLQTMRNVLTRRPADLSPWPGARLSLPMADDSGDRLAAMRHATDDTPDRPLAVLIHGLTGCEDSSYIRATARHLLRNGVPVLRLNLRGAGPSRPLCRFQYHAGRSEDLRDALTALLHDDPGLRDRGLVLIGYSLGANMLIKFLAEHGDAFPIRAAAAVSAPVDLKATQERMMALRNRVYHHYLLTRMKAEAVGGAAEVSEAERAALLAAKTIYAIDDRFIAPRNGFDGAADYYRRCSARQFLTDVPVPTLVIHGLDDPWIPAAPYLDTDWSRLPRITALLPAHGGHVGFHGRGSAVPWHDCCILGFLRGKI